MSRLLAWAIIVSLTLVANAGSVNSEPAPGDGSKIGQLHGRDWTLTSLRKAQVELETAADEQEASGESLKAWEQLNDAARISLITSEVASGMRILDRALLLPRTAETREQRAISHSLYALLSQQRSDRKETERHSRIALDSLPFLNSAVAKAYVHFSAGVNAYYYGKNRDAVDRFEAAGSLVPFPEDPFLTNQVCLFSGYARLRDGDSSSASAWMDRALSYAESDDYSRGSALAHFGKGYAHFFRNEKQLALESFKRAYALFPDDFEWREKGRTKNAMGQIYLQMSDHGLAAAHFREAIEFYDRVDYSVGKITALTNLGEAYHQGGDGGSAKATLQEARNLSEKIGDKFRVAVAEEGLGNIFLSERKAEEAIRLYRSALAIYEKIGIRFPVINNLLGKAYLQKGNTKLAGEFFELALRENEEIRDNIQISESLYELAKLDLADGGIESAISRIERSLKLTETTYRDIENSGLRRTFLSNSHRKYGLYIDLLMESHRRAPEAGFDRKALLASERARARSMLETIRLSGADHVSMTDPLLDDQEKETVLKLNVKADRLTDLLAAARQEPAEIQSVEAEVSVLQHQLEDIRSAQRRYIKGRPSIEEPNEAHIEQLQKLALGEDTVLLEYSLDEARSYLWALSGDKLVSVVLPGQAEIEKHVDSLRGSLLARHILPGETAPEYQVRMNRADVEYRQSSSALSSIILGPVASLLEEKNIIVVSDGKLALVPFAALPFPNDVDHIPLLTTNEITYAPSAKMILWLGHQSRAIERKGGGVLVYSDPVFSSDDGRVTGAANVITSESGVDKLRFVESLESLTRLPGSAEEAAAVRVSVRGAPVEVVSGFEANRKRLLETDLSRYSVLHFATHGMIDSHRPYLSGIVLSRFDRDGARLNELVRLEDIYSLRLNADLVVLSACDSGIGKEVKGDGIRSLSTAFLQSGSDAVLATLWKVEDAATRELINHFYSAIANDGMTAPQALRHAQRSLAQDPRFSSPFYWASFVLQGNPEVKPELGRQAWAPGQRLLLIAGMAGAGVLLLAYRRRFRDATARVVGR